MESAPKCSCGNQSIKKEFSTFKYYYCTACKIEVGQGTPVKPITPLWDWDSKKPLPQVNLKTPVSGKLPAGYCALKGEGVTCYNCGVEHGTLRQDLPDGVTQYRMFGGTGSFIDFNTLGKCCDDMKIDRYNASQCFTEFYVKGRGWV
jgi:hypothetical protein